MKPEFIVLYFGKTPLRFFKRFRWDDWQYEIIPEEQATKFPTLQAAHERALVCGIAPDQFTVKQLPTNTSHQLH